MLAHLVHIILLELIYLTSMSLNSRCHTSTPSRSFKLQIQKVHVNISCRVLISVKNIVPVQCAARQVHQLPECVCLDLHFREEHQNDVSSPQTNNYSETIINFALLGNSPQHLIVLMLIASGTGRAARI